MRAKAATSGDPQQRALGGRGSLCLLCRRSSPPQPLPHAPGRALHSPGFPSGPARLGSCQGTELTFASREFQLAADQISGRARLSGHRGGAAPPRHAAPNALQMGTKMGTQLHLPPRGGGNWRPRREELPTGGRGCAPSPARLGSHSGQGSSQHDPCNSPCLLHSGEVPATLTSSPGGHRALPPPEERFRHL